ncbi:MAG: hypothetical protein K6B72_00680 [Lachnospiraceae bacterium]|nr:hypothetical protein [Lachnospiraceae bacterium]
MTELKDNTLEQVTGGAAAEKSTDPVAYCPKCKSKMKYIDQVRIEGGNTSRFQCENTTCTERYLIKTNLEVLFSL